MSPLELSRRGVGRTFQTLQVFGKLSVRDNLIAAAQEFKGTMPGRLFAQARRRARPSRRRDDRAVPAEARRAACRRAASPTASRSSSTSRWRSCPRRGSCCSTSPAPASIRASSTSCATCSCELNKTQGGSFVVIEHNMDFIMKLCPHVSAWSRARCSPRGRRRKCRRTARCSKLIWETEWQRAARVSMERHGREDHRVRQGRRRLLAEPDDPERDDARRAQGARSRC